MWLLRHQNRKNAEKHAFSNQNFSPTPVETNDGQAELRKKGGARLACYPTWPSGGRGKGPLCRVVVKKRIRGGRGLTSIISALDYRGGGGAKLLSGFFDISPQLKEEEEEEEKDLGRTLITEKMGVEMPILLPANIFSKVTATPCMSARKIFQYRLAPMTQVKA